MIERVRMQMVVQGADDPETLAYVNWAITEHEIRRRVLGWRTYEPRFWRNQEDYE